MTLEVIKNDFLRQFETRVEEKLIKLEFSEQDKNIFLTRFEIHKSLKAEDYRDEFIKIVLDKLSKQEKKVIPTCPKVASYFKNHRATYKHLLPIGINL